MKPRMIALNGICLLISVIINIAASAQVRTQAVALSSEIAPGTSGDSFFASGAGDIFGPPMISNEGKVAFWARTHPVADPWSTQYGLWVGEPGNLSMIARTGDPAPGFSAGSAYLQIWNNDGIEMRLNELGEVAFFCEVTGSAIEGDLRQGCICTGDPNDLRWVVGHGDPAIAAGEDVFFYLASPSSLTPHFIVFNDRGEIATLLSHMDVDGTPLGYHGIWAGTANSLTPAAMLYEHAPGTPEDVYFSSLDPVTMAINSAGQVAFIARINGPSVHGFGDNMGIWMGPPGQVQLVAREAEQAVGVPDGVCYSGIPVNGRVAINNAGMVAFKADMQGGPPYDRGIWAGRPGELTLVARSSDPAPGFPGGSFSNFESASLAANNLVAFRATVSTSSPPGTVHAIYAGTPSHINLVIREGLQVPNMAQGVVFANIWAFDTHLNRHGQVVFEALLQGPGITEDNDESLWVGDHRGALWLILQEGEPIEIAPGEQRVYREFEVHKSLTGEDGRSRCLNDAGRLVFRAKTGPVGDAAILIAQVPICGDCDSDGDVDLDDLNIFVAVLLSQDTTPSRILASDINHDGVADGGDIAAFTGILLE